MQKYIDFFSRLEWQNDRMILNGRTFRLQHDGGDWSGEPDHFIFYKIKYLVDQYERFFQTRPDFSPKRMFELGLWDGGSMVFWFELFHPEKHIGIDYQQKQAPAIFQQYLMQNDLSERLKPNWGVDQRDSVRLRDIWAREFDSLPLDLVIDDASHLYGPTKASFETLFPLVRPGGLYIIEDWAWGHWKEFLVPSHPWFNERPMTDFIVELLEAAGTANTLIHNIHVYQGFVVVERGQAALDPASSFSLDQHIINRRKMTDRSTS